MKEIEAGHTYILDHVTTGGVESLTFIKRSGGSIKHDVEHPGTNTQEVIRALIARTKYLNNLVPCNETVDALYHLRMALYNYEVRALRRKREKANRTSDSHDDLARPNVHRTGEKDIPFTEYKIEFLPTDKDGHIL